MPSVCRERVPPAMGTSRIPHNSSPIPFQSNLLLNFVTRSSQICVYSLAFPAGR